MENDLKILLVEDNPGDAFLVKFYLEESVFKNAQFIHTEFLDSALDILSKNKIDVVLLDLNLPDSKGVETVQQILDHSGAVVIVLTGLADNELGVQTVKLGAQDFLVKGQFDGKVLTSSIRYAFERAQLKQRVRELDENKTQFQEAQEIAELGFWVLNTETSELWITNHLKKLLDIKEQPNYQLNHLLRKFVNKEELEKSINQLIDTYENLDFKVQLKSDKKSEYRFKAKYRTNKKTLAGIVQKLI